MSVDEVYSSLSQNGQTVSDSKHTSNISSNALPEAIIDAHSTEQGHPSDCGDQDVAQHQCHMGHCAFTVFSDLNLTNYKGSGVLLDLSLSSLVGIEHSGPRKPPRA